MGDNHDDEVLAALDRLLVVVEERGYADHVARRAETITRRRQEGDAYRDIVTEESRPLIVEVLSDHIEDLVRASARFRRAEAAALYAEGLTMDQIAGLFGVTRQRISALLREARNGSDAPSAR